MTIDLPAGRRFLDTEGRVLERRLAACLLDGAEPAGVVDALRGYRNPDGGFGWGIDPDTGASASYPLGVQTAFEAMDAAGTPDPDLVRGACDYLATLGDGVGCLVPAALDGPRASHWDDWALEPSINPTAAIAGLLWKWDVDHPWRAAATSFCWKVIEEGIPQEAHAAKCLVPFLEHAPTPDRRVEDAVGALRTGLPSMPWFNAEPVDTYGVTPLHLVPAPAGRRFPLFPPDQLERHLDALAAAQLPDGGWPIAWEPIGPATEAACRGMETLRALRTLDAYGRLPTS